MKILVTAFEPFGGEKINPAQEAVRQMRAPEGAELVKLAVPTAFRTCVETVRAAMRREAPDAVLCVGQAGGRSGLTVERVAVNMDDAAIPDNEGERPVDVPVVAGGPAAYFATLPVKEIVAAIREGGLPAAVSNTAGTFVCNHLMYGMLHGAACEFPSTRGGFLHVPFLPGQAASRADTPSMSLADIVRGLEIAVRTVVREAAR